MKKLLLLIAFIFSMTIVSAQSTYIYCGKLVDTKSGKVLSKKTIVVKGNKIESVLDGYVKPKNKNDKQIDLKNKVVMPGLIDMHVHIEQEFSPRT
ncbi:MAG: amidohydrolase family protein, partial [Flavobacteriaceae bacterium]|nr:amidohydrolase family protein [Flavobacteriaceae bacterium]